MGARDGNRGLRGGGDEEGRAANVGARDGNRGLSGGGDEEGRAANVGACDSDILFLDKVISSICRARVTL